MAHDGTSHSSTTDTVIGAEELKTIYTSAFAQDARISDVLRVLDAIIARDTEEDLETADILAAISALRSLILANTREILNLHKLIGLLIFELIKQGIEIENKQLLNELNLYAKNG